MSIKLCLVGCGGMAVGGHGPALRKYASEHDDVELAACCDVDPIKAENFRKEFGFARCYTDMDRMISLEKPDAVSLIVPVSLTHTLTVQMLQAGIPVFLEKPPGMNREQTLHMMEVARRTETPNQVAFNRRYMPLIRRFARLRQGCDPHFWQYDFYRTGRKDVDFSTTSIHGIDTLRFLVGSSYRSVDFQYLTNPAGEEYVPTILLDCEFEDGQRGRITFVPGSGGAAERCIMHGGNDCISVNLPYHGVHGSLDGSGNLMHMRLAQELYREVTDENEESFVSNGFYGENAAFLDCVRSGVKSVDDIASGLQAVEIADCIRCRKSHYGA